MFLTVVIKAGYDPTQLGRRIAGQTAVVARAPRTPRRTCRSGFSALPTGSAWSQGTSERRWPGPYREEGVRRAYLGAFPGQYPDS